MNHTGMDPDHFEFFPQNVAQMLYKKYTPWLAEYKQNHPNSQGPVSGYQKRLMRTLGRNMTNLDPMETYEAGHKWIEIHDKQGIKPNFDTSDAAIDELADLADQDDDMPED